MKKLLLSAGMTLSLAMALNAQIGIGTTSPDASAALEVSATDKGILIPRMSSAQRIAISNPANGLMVFDNDTNSQWTYISGAWVQSTPGVGKFIDGASSDIAFYPDRVGIGLNSFATHHKLYVEQIQTQDGPNVSAIIRGVFDGTGSASTTYGLEATARNNSTGTINYAIGTRGIADNASGNTNYGVGSWPQVLNQGSIFFGSGIIADITNSSGGSMTTGRAQNLTVYNNAGATMQTTSLSSMYMENSGTVTGDGYGLWIGGNSTGTVGGNVYALYIATPFSNVAGNNFALYSDNTANSYFEGSVGIGTSDPQQKVHISGALRLEPQDNPPAGAGEGDIYADTDGKLYYHNGTGWNALQFE